MKLFHLRCLFDCLLLFFLPLVVFATFVSMVTLSYLWLHFLTAVNDKFAKINSRFLIVEAEAIDVEAEAIEK